MKFLEFLMFWKLSDPEPAPADKLKAALQATSRSVAKLSIKMGGLIARKQEIDADIVVAKQEIEKSASKAAIQKADDLQSARISNLKELADLQAELILIQEKVEEAKNDQLPIEARIEAAMEFA